jgi:cytochrome c553
MTSLFSSARALLVTAVTSVALFGLAPSALAQKITGDVRAGESKIAMCIGCHGIQGYQASFPEIYRVPRISGQTSGYIVAALNAYKTGERKHPTMKAIAANLSDQDMADMAAYYAQHGQEGAPKLAEKPAKAPDAAVAKLFEKGACISCHGDNFAKPNADNVPLLAGQYNDFLFVALKSYANNTNATWGRGNAVMGGMVKQYSNAELKLMAKYIGSLDTNLKTMPQKKFR